MCNNETGDVSVLDSFCLTSFDLQTRNCSNDAVIGRCLYSLDHGHYTTSSNGLYIKVDPNITKQEQQLCGYLNREGRLCGKCKENHFVSPYSYDMKCYKCQTGLLVNIILYLTVAYVPLTIFLVVVMGFRISVTTPRLYTSVMVCQILAVPSYLRFFTQITRNSPIVLSVNFIATTYGIWNLDFLRTLIPPICLPLTTTQTMSLDYLIALYPLLLLACFHGIMKAHDRGYRLVVKMLRPFLVCTARLRQQWNIRHSIINAFATFLILSYSKFLNTSCDLLIPTNVFGVRGQWLGYFLYYDATVEFMGPQHMPYAILAVIILTGVFFTLLLLLLYPTLWFQKCLNRRKWNSPGLQMFMQCFQGYYRDRTDGGRECRYFAAMYPSFRIVGYITYAVTRSSIFFPIMTIVMAGIITTLVIVCPYKKEYELYNKLDILMFLTLLVYSAGYETTLLTFDRKQLSPIFGYTISALVSLVPLLYLSAQLARWMKRGIIQKCSACLLHSYYKSTANKDTINDSKPLLESVR